MNRADSITSVLIPISTAVMVFISFTGCSHEQAPEKIDLESLSVEELIRMVREDKSFPAMLRLRDLKDERAFPVFKEHLELYPGTGNIFGFAAAQGLYMIDSEESHKVLSKYLLRREYDIWLSLKYVFHWHSEKGEFNGFIRDYHLKNTADEFQVTLSVDSTDTMGFQEFEFTVVIKNTSDKTLRTFDSPSRIISSFIIEAEDGSFSRFIQNVVFEERIDFPELAPDDSISHVLKTEAGFPEGDQIKSGVDNHDGSLVLFIGFVKAFKQIYYILGKPGKYKVYAYHSGNTGTAEYYRKNKGWENMWAGRVISEPVGITIKDR